MFNFIFVFLLFTQPSPSAVNLPELKWKFMTVEDDMGTPRTDIFLLVNNKEYMIAKGTGNFETLEKDQYKSSQYQIPEKALLACAGFWAGLGHQLYVTQKGNVLEIKEGFLEAESNRGTKVRFKTIKKISL